MADDSLLSRESTLQNMLIGYWLSQPLHVAARLELSDHLAAGPKSAEELAELTQTHAPSLYRLLRALASLGVYEEDSAQRFHLTTMGRALCKDDPNSAWGWAMLMGDDHYLAWSELLYSVRTGKSGFEKVYGQKVFEYYPEHPERGAIFDRAMQSVHGRETAAMLEVYDFSRFGTLMDVGGGNGSLIAEVLKATPTLRGLLLDMPSVIPRANDYLSAAGLATRCHTVAGNFFERVIEGADAIVMRHILHDWTDEQCHTILRNCHAALPSSGTLIIVEAVIPPGNAPSFAKLLDLTMLVIPGGRERTAEEFNQLLSAAGFKLTRIVPTATEMSVIEAVKA